MDLKLLKDLRRKMLKEANIEDVWRFFLDHFGESEEFLRLGAPLTEMNHPMVGAIAHAANAMFARYAIPVKINDAILLDNCVLVRVPEHGIIHGSMLLEGYMASALYLEDIQMGALYMYLKPGRSDYARFSLTRAPDSSTPRH